jgi:hypothetical protein
MRNCTFKKLFKLISMVMLGGLIGGVSCLVSAQEVVLAFDKTLGRSTSLDGMARSQMLIRNLIKADVPQAIFLIHSSDITPKTEERVMLYDDAGQLLVNAGSKHFFYSRSNAYSYQVDLLKANADLEPYLNYHQHVYFPYLYEGSDTQILQSLKEFLTSHDYLPMYVTYQANDDYIDLLYQARLADNKYVDIRRLEAAYVNLLVDDISAYDAKARLYLGYSPRQVVLLHENDLAAYCIIGLIDELNKKGFKVVAPGNTFSDPVANPFYWGGYSATGYLQAVLGLPEPRRDSMPILTGAQKQKIHRYLNDQGLSDLIH